MRPCSVTPVASREARASLYDAVLSPSFGPEELPPREQFLAWTAHTATPDEDGRAGVEWARANVARFKHRSTLNPDLAEAGVVVTRWPDTVTTRDAKRTLGLLEETLGDLLLRPFVPERVAVREARAGEVWWGDYSNGQAVADALSDIVDVLWPATAQMEVSR